PPPPTAPPLSPLYQLHLPYPGDDFSLRVTRKPHPGSGQGGTGGSGGGGGSGLGGGGDESLLDLSGGGCLVVKPQFLQLRSAVAPEVDLYGMGESTPAEGLRLRRDGVPRALWNSDTPAAATGVNLYGSHPLLYGLAPGGTSFGWFLAASNAMDVVPGVRDVAFRLTGGTLELFLFAGPAPEDVTVQYTQLVGPPAMPPRWALGFHQS
ncbi:Alpha/beta-glucosidase agdC, partial [Tetrabaena socialis]